MTRGVVKDNKGAGTIKILEHPNKDILGPAILSFIERLSFIGSQ